ncbi:MAG: type II toxin-antitoxin system RelE/ParE family toxin [Anaerolineaceae bacterium]|nr:MAG: type II toxin-antitoxin system RelE/ParE family toxin [Anaerolineaceae bacterium]
MPILRILESAARDLANLDKPVARRIVLRLNWMVENFDGIRHIPLSGELSEFYKFRVGDYRVLYQVLDNEKTILIHAVGHRRDIYRGRK